MFRELSFLFLGMSEDMLHTLAVSSPSFERQEVDDDDDDEHGDWFF